MVAAAAPRYEIVCRLAGGGMADLFLARAAGVGGFERLVVVKRLNSQMQSNPAMVQSLFDEARIAATLSHANIVAVNDVEVVDGQVSIVMEYLHGHDVSHLVRRLGKVGERVPPAQAMAIGLGVCAGLHHAHERVGPDGKSLDIVHRDVSPHNVFVTYDGAVKIIDFGIARATTRKGHTEHGVIKGKPGYIAPEQVRGKVVDRRTDVWSTAVLLYEMTTGTAPFGHGAVAFDQLVAVVTEDPAPPSTRVSDYPRDLEAIVMRGMAREPAERYSTAEAMRLDLEAYARARGLDMSPFGLASLMERVFGTQLGAWRTAQREGRSLSEHVAALRLSGMHRIIEEDVDDTAPLPDPDGSQRLADLETQLAAEREETVSDPDPPVEPPRPRLARKWRIAIGVVAAPVVVIGGMALWSVIGATHHSAAASPPPPVEAQGSATVEPIVEPIPPPPTIEPSAPTVPVAAPTPPPDPTAGSDDEIAIDPPQHDSPFSGPPKRRGITRPHVVRPATAPATSTKSASPPSHSSPAHAPHAPAAPPAPPDPDAPLPR